MLKVQEEDDDEEDQEIDAAINHFTTVERRFTNEPDTCLKITKILDSHQKEQCGIKEVFHEVSMLLDE